MPWQWLYVIAGGVCTLLILGALFVKYPTYNTQPSSSTDKVSLWNSLALVKNPYAMGFSIGAFLYVAAESAIYVWMPTYLVCDATSMKEEKVCIEIFTYYRTSPLCENVLPVAAH